MNSHQRKVESKKILKEIEAEIITIQSLFLNNDINSKEFKNLSLSDLKYFRKSLNKVIEELKTKKKSNIVVRNIALKVNLKK